MPYQFGLSQLAVPVPSMSHFLSRIMSPVRNLNFQAVGPSPSNPEALARGLKLVLGQSECNPRTLERYDTRTVEAKAITARISPFFTGITRRKKKFSFSFLCFFFFILIFYFPSFCPCRPYLLVSKAGICRLLDRIAN
jgi:hypothetical protein